MKPLKSCVNGDGRPVCSPSLVLCEECLDGIEDKLEKMIKAFPKPTEK